MSLCTLTPNPTIATLIYAARHRRQSPTRCNGCVLNAAARVVTNTRKFDRGLSTLLQDELNFLDVPERVTFKLGLMTYRCLYSQAPRYLVIAYSVSMHERNANSI